MCALVPGVESGAGSRTTRFSAADMLEVLDLLIVQAALASAVGQQAPYS